MLDWKQIDTVLLDMDGTLLDLHYDNYFWTSYLPGRYAEVHRISLLEAEKKLFAQLESQRGSLNWYCLHYWSRELQLDVPAIYREIEDRIALRPHTANFLRGLRKLDKYTLLVTNAHPDNLNHKLLYTGINQWLDEIISSHHLHHPKEQAAFWPALRQRVVFDPARTLFIDDNLSVLAAARDYGITHLLCIRQPDSRGPLRDISEFPAICDFDEIFNDTHLQIAKAL